MVYNDPEKDLGYVKPLKTKVIVHTKLPQGTMFYIMSVMI